MPSEVSDPTQGSASFLRAVSSRLPRLTATLISLIIWLCGATVSTAQSLNTEINSRRAAERTSFSDDEIKDGFFKTALGAELKFDRSAERIRKFDDPVRVYVIDQAVGQDRHADISKVVSDIQARVDHLDMAMTDDRQAANITVTLVRRADFAATVKSRYGAAKARQIEQALHPQCLSGIAIDKSFRIRRAEVILPVDAGDFTLYDCAYEELLQVLGVVNDDRSVPWTMFNDDVQMGFFDIYDQHLLNILYDPRVQPGMTRTEVDQLMPEVLPRVRKWVIGANPEKVWKSSGESDKRYDAACACDAPDRHAANVK